MRLPFALSWALAPLLSYAAPSKRDVPSAASFYVPSLPGLEMDPSRPLHMYAGHLESDPSRKNAPQTEITPHLYFFMIKARRLADKERVIFWFNGGPGCSSFDGLMLEVGPFRTNGQGGLKWVEGSWDEYTTMVFVDQPVGTGFSYTGQDNYVHELDEAAGQVVEFMRNFYSVFPDYQNMDTFVAGESFAGQYIPYIAQAILSSNLPTPLKGLAIGNGWIDGESQYPGYLEYALKHNLIEKGTDLYKEVEEANEKCLKVLRDNKGPQRPSVPVCENLSTLILKDFTKEAGDRKVCLNVYDIRLSDDYPACGANWPNELSDMTPYLRRDDVVKAIHASDKSEAWKECTGRVGTKLKLTKSASSITLVPQLLEKLEILLFSGDQDWICNYVGTERLIANMNWNGAKGLAGAQTLPWVVNGVDSGTWVNSRNLTYVKVYNSSHMVPYDLPQASHDMMLRFMGVDLTQLASGSAKVPSKVGNDTKPGLQPTTLDASIGEPTGSPASEKSPEQDKAMWEAYYNAGSAALSLLAIALVVGLFFLCRQRRRQRLGHVAVPKDDPEEAIPLQDSRTTEYRDGDLEQRNGSSLPLEGKMVFEVGDSDGEDEPHTGRRRPT